MELFRHTLAFFFSLLALAGLAVLFFRLESGRKKLAGRILGPEAAKVSAGVSFRRNVRLACAIAGLFFLIAAACVPQWGVELAPVTDMRGSLIVAVDVSLSMAAKDLKPNRLEHARLLLNDLAERLSEYRVGIVAFAGRAYTQCPLTDDSEAIKYFASQLKPGMLPFQGTDFASVLDRSLAMTEKITGTKVLVIITDGEDHSGKIDFALKQAQEADMKIFTVGLGSPEGELVPLTDSMGNILGYKKDRNGKPVVSRLNEGNLMKMASATGAAYVRYVSPDSASEAVLSSINRLTLEKTKGKARAAFKNRYQWPLVLAFIFLLIELLIMDKNLFSGWKFNAKKSSRMLVTAVFSMLLPVLMTSSAWAESAKSLARTGNEHFRKGEYKEAEAKYEEALSADPSNRKILYNLGVAQYKNGEFEKARRTFESLEGSGLPSYEDIEAGSNAGTMEGGPMPWPGNSYPGLSNSMSIKSLFNKANSFYKAGDIPSSIKTWKKVLDMDPNNEDAKFNLQKAIMNKQPPQCQNPKQDPSNQNKDNKNNKNQGGNDKGRDGDEKKDKGDGGSGQDKDKQNKGSEDKKKEQQDRQQKERERKKQREKEQAEQLLQMMAEKEKSDAERKQAEVRKVNARHQSMQTEEDW